jgi:ubiquinone/menaquinone biosynthesis C-methylase UbiE
MNKNKLNIDLGFSKISNQYESLEKTSSLINWMRKRVQNHLERQLKPNSKILEINCGSGIDAVYLAKKGHQIFATDIADGMINHVNDKIKIYNLQQNLSCKKLSYLDLNILNTKKFDHIFSNFGGLNCSNKNELNQVFNSFNNLLLPNGKITLVIMPKICIWEFLRIFKFDRTAFRRLNKNGVIANIEGEKVRTFYHSANQIKQMLSNNFTKFNIENISFIGPTGNKVNFPKKYPILFKILKNLDYLSNKIPFLQGYGDYYIISATKKNK